MFGHDGDDYDEELMAHDRFVLLANDMYQEKFHREDIIARLIALNCKREDAERIYKLIEQREKQRRLERIAKVFRQRNVRSMNRRNEGRERKIGISRILDSDDYVRER